MKLTFYLFKESVTEFEEAIKAARFSGDDAFCELPLKKAVPFATRAFFQRNRRTKPKWIDFITENFEIDSSEIFNVTNSFLFLIKIDSRIFAITKGYGFNAIDRNQLERGFGLRVVLNEIDPRKIREIDARKIDTTTKQKRVLLNRNSPLYDFDFDTDEDLLHLISGTPSDMDLARKLVGTDSLNWTGDIEFRDIAEKCRALLEAFQKENYKDYFAFIDNLQQIKAKPVTTQASHHDM